VCDNNDDNEIDWFIAIHCNLLTLSVYYYNDIFYCIYYCYIYKNENRNCALTTLTSRLHGGFSRPVMYLYLRIYTEVCVIIHFLCTSRIISDISIYGKLNTALDNQNYRVEPRRNSSLVELTAPAESAVSREREQPADSREH